MRMRCQHNSLHTYSQSPTPSMHPNQPRLLNQPKPNQPKFNNTALHIIIVHPHPYLPPPSHLPPPPLPTCLVQSNQPPRDPPAHVARCPGSAARRVGLHGWRAASREAPRADRWARGVREGEEWGWDTCVGLWSVVVILGLGLGLGGDVMEGGVRGAWE